MRHDLKECGKRIQQLRNERGLTQEQLAEKLNNCGIHRFSVFR